MRLVASMEDSRFMKPSRFPARDEYAAREEDESARREAAVLERGQNRSKSAGREGAPESLSDFVHGDAIDKKLTIHRASVPVLIFVSCRRGAFTNVRTDGHRRITILVACV